MHWLMDSRWWWWICRVFTHILVLTQVGSAVRAHVLDYRGVYALRQLQNGIPKGREGRLSLCVYTAA